MPFHVFNSQNCHSNYYILLDCVRLFTHILLLKDLNAMMLSKVPFAASVLELMLILADSSSESADSNTDAPVGMQLLPTFPNHWLTLCRVGQLSLSNMFNI